MNRIASGYGLTTIIDYSILRYRTCLLVTIIRVILTRGADLNALIGQAASECWDRHLSVWRSICHIAHDAVIGGGDRVSN
jgi:hypothetical protein